VTVLKDPGNSCEQLTHIPALRRTVSSPPCLIKDLSDYVSPFSRGPEVSFGDSCHNGTFTEPIGRNRPQAQKIEHHIIPNFVLETPENFQWHVNIYKSGHQIDPREDPEIVSCSWVKKFPHWQENKFTKSDMCQFLIEMHTCTEEKQAHSPDTNVPASHEHIVRRDVLSQRMGYLDLARSYNTALLAIIDTDQLKEPPVDTGTSAEISQTTEKPSISTEIDFSSIRIKTEQPVEDLSQNLEMENVHSLDMQYNCPVYKIVQA